MQEKITTTDWQHQFETNITRGFYKERVPYGKK